MRSMRLLMLALALAACGAKPALTPEYTGCGKDENWIAFDDQEPNATVADATAPQILTPMNGATLPFASPPTFTWNQDQNDPGTPLGDVIHDGPGCNMCCTQWNTGALTVMHLAPISGDVYDLQFLVAGSLSWRLVTTLQEWLPTASTWAMWKGKTVTVKIFRMNVLKDDVKMGPFTPSTAFSFTVGS